MLLTVKKDRFEGKIYLTYDKKFGTLIASFYNRSYYLNTKSMITESEAHTIVANLRDGLEWKGYKVSGGKYRPNSRVKIHLIHLNTSLISDIAYASRMYNMPERMMMR